MKPTTSPLPRARTWYLKMIRALPPTPYTVYGTPYSPEQYSPVDSIQKSCRDLTISPSRLSAVESCQNALTNMPNFELASR